MPKQLVHGWSGQVGSIFPISLYGTQDSEVVKKKSFSAGLPVHNK